jgi:hypothetical protein
MSSPPNLDQFAFDESFARLQGDSNMYILWTPVLAFRPLFPDDMLIKSYKCARE